MRLLQVSGRRLCALLAATSALLHALMLGHAANAAAGGVLAVMAVGCLYCARDLWRRGTPGVWCTVALMNLAMIAVHTPMPAHHHVAGPVPAQSALMNLTVLLAFTEVVIAGTVLYCATRKPPPSVGARPHANSGPNRFAQSCNTGICRSSSWS